MCIFFWYKTLSPYALSTSQMLSVGDHQHDRFIWKSTFLLYRHPDKTINKRNSKQIDSNKKGNNNNYTHKKIEIELYFTDVHTCKWPILKNQRRIWTGLLALLLVSADRRTNQWNTWDRFGSSSFFFRWYEYSSRMCLCVHRVCVCVPVILLKTDKEGVFRKLCTHRNSVCWHLFDIHRESVSR